MGWKEDIADINRKVDDLLTQSVQAQVERLEMRDGDILVVSYKQKVSSDDLTKMRLGILTFLKENGRTRVDVLVTDDDPTFTVLGQED